MMHHKHSSVLARILRISDGCEKREKKGRVVGPEENTN
jgi:hypothetical protein